MASIGAQGPHRTQAALTLRSFYRWARRRGHVPVDPAEDMLPRPTPPPPPRSFSEEELIRLLVAAAWRDERRAWAILACYALGMRRSEFCAVTPEQISGDELEVRGKGMRVRRIPLAYLQREAVEGLRPWWNGTIVGSVKPPTFTAWVNRAAKDSGIPWDRRRAHMLRAGLAKSLSERGVPVEDIRDILGHENVRTTNRYLESRAADRREAMARLGRV
jgi:integrase/recombinase XerC